MNRFTLLLLLFLAASHAGAEMKDQTLTEAFEAAKGKFAGLRAHQKQWTESLFTAGHRCISGWGDKYGKEYPAFIDKIEALGRETAAAAEAIKGEIPMHSGSAVPAKLSSADACGNAGKELLPKLKSSYALLQKGVAALKQKLSAINLLQIKVDDRFVNDAGKEVKTNFACPSKEVYFEATETAFGDADNPNGSGKADNAFHTAAYATEDLETKLRFEAGNLKKFIAELEAERTVCGVGTSAAAQGPEANGSAE